MLKSDDEMNVYQGVWQLRSALSYAQENQMQGFATEQYMDILVKIVQRDPLTDLSTEVKLFAIQCLTTLMDIFPSLVNGLVHAGLLKGMAGVLQTSLGFVEVTEACIKAYEKVAVENPPAVLRCGAVGCILQQLEVLEMGTQQRVFRILQKIARHSSSEADFDTHLLPVLPFICMGLAPDEAQGDTKRVEDLSKIICEIQESFCLFYSPTQDFEKVTAQFDKLLEAGVFDIILEHIRRFAETQTRLLGPEAQSKVERLPLFGEQHIDSGPQEQVLSHQAVLNFFKALECASRYSHRVANKLFGESSLLQNLSSFLPHGARQTQQVNSEEFPLIMDAINLLHSLFSEKEETAAEEAKPAEHGKARREHERQKRDYQLAPGRRAQLAGVAEHLLPRVFSVYETSINPQFRIRTLQVIDKVIALLDHELLQGFIGPNQFANFVFQILRSRHSSSIAVALQIARKVLDGSPMTYSVPFIREGVSQLIASISTEEKFKAFLGISGATNISDKAFDLDIHEVKEALHAARASNPDDHAMRDYYERKLLELVERQRHPAGLATSGAKASKTGASKSSPPQDGPEKANLPLRIIGLAQALLADYFENPAFLEALRAHSPQTKLQLSLLSELTQLSRDLSNEATQTQLSASELAGVRGLLARVGELLTLEGCAITSYEFKQSHLLWALELLLTKSPSQAKVALERRRVRDTGEEMKRAEEIDLLEAQRQSKQLSKKEGRCLILRLKHAAHVLLSGRGQNSAASPLRALIELNQKVISENDSTLVSGAGSGAGGPPGGFPGHPGGSFAREMGLAGMFASGAPSSYGDYDHCISALRQLQKRVTVSLVYDPKKELMKAGKAGAEELRDAEIPLDGKEDKEEEHLDFGDLFEDSQMEDQSPDTSGPDKSAEALKALPPQPLKKKGLSHPAALMKLAASPAKDGTPSAIEQQKLNSSKVFLKRHSLYSELGQIPVTVEQSSCLQILEDFLRNRVKTLEQVKGLRFDYGFGGFGGGGPPGSSLAGPGGAPFGGALQGQYQSITQKILRKSLGSGARKLLDSANERLSKILSAGAAYRIKPKGKGKKVAKLGEDSADEMEGVEGAEKSGSEEDSHSDGYGEMDEDEEEEQEMAAEIEKQRLLDLFVEELADEILAADIPEDQQHVLAKILTRQHAFTADQLKMNFEDAAPEDADLADIAAARQEEMYRLEERLEDFQETMERVQARFADKQAERREAKKALGVEEAKQGSGKKPAGGEGLFSGPGDGDQEMIDQSEEAEDRSEKAGGSQAPAKQPGLKLPAHASDAEMLKPSDHSDAGAGSPKEGGSKPGDQHSSLAGEDAELEARKKSLEQMLEKEFAEQDKKIEQALAREKELQAKFKGVGQGLRERGAIDASGVSAQTQEVLAQDLEELIKQQGEDIDFEFYYEGKRIVPNQSMFEIFKDSEGKLRQAERAALRADQVRALQAKEEELKRAARRIAEAKGAKSEEQIAQLKREADRLRELLHQASGHLGGGPRGGPPGFLAGLNAHKVYFCISDKADEVSELKRQRLDSLAELTGAAAKRGRTKSEAVQDISSGAIDEFVQRLLEKEFKVFDEDEESEGKEPAGTAARQPPLPKIDEEMAEDNCIESSTEPRPAEAGATASAEQFQDLEKEQLGQALKILKVLHYLCAHQDLISERGIRLLMKGSSTEADEEGSQGLPLAGSPGKQGGAGSGPSSMFSDLDLKAGFAAVPASAFHHHKLDSYLQRSIKDPYNLVQGAISPRMQQIFQNCPFLFPFSTKQLYFKLVSFISSIDVHRAIYFLRQYLRQTGGQKPPSHEKDNLRKIAKQKVLIQRDKLISSAFSLIQKIDKRSFLEFEFQGEEGTGLGPTLEFYDNIAEEFKSWKIPIGDEGHFDMWRKCADGLLFPHPACLTSLSADNIKQIYDVFRLCGTIVAKAIVDDRQIDLPISPLFWRLCIGEQLSIYDMQELDATVFSTLAEFQIIASKAQDIEEGSRIKKLSDEVRNRQLQSLTISNGSRVEDYALVFTLPCYDDIELISGGNEMDVSLDNAQDYVDLVLHFTFHETVKIQVQAFKKGFDEMFPISSLKPFLYSSSEDGELEIMICGIKCNDPEWQSKEELIKYIEPVHGYTRKSDQYLYLIRYITELNVYQRQSFLKFLTGSKRLPSGGFRMLEPKLTLAMTRENPGQHPDEILPSVMSCQNYMKSPRYSSYEVFKMRFDYALEEGQQNFTLS